MIKKILLLLPTLLLNSCVTLKSETLYVPFSSFALQDNTFITINNQITIDNFKINFNVINYADYQTQGPINTFYENARSESGILFNYNEDKYYYQVDVDLEVNKTIMDKTIFILESYKTEKRIYRFTANIKFSSLEMYGNFYATFLIFGRDNIDASINNFRCVDDSRIIKQEERVDFELTVL